ncbi:ABC transporter permease [Microlunatus sp. GCM10028923]|uniref:ABC transporter permease n=1 Tax=Microlunatus sp. GCM10028923 TaxID=3273400 RepID=UPI003623C955
MIRFALNRLASALLLFVVVSFVSYAMVFSNGPAIARAILGPDAGQDQVAAKVVELQLDQPVITQYGQWLLALVTRGDLGRSFYTQDSVSWLLASRIPVTLSVMIVVMLGTALISVLIGVVAAVRGGWVDRVLQFFAVLGAAVPQFVVAIGLIIAFAITVRWFPPTGYVSLLKNPAGWMASLALPWTAVLIGSAASAAQQFRGAVADVLRQDFVRTLRTRGISERAIIFRHVLRNAAAPGLTILGLQIVGMMGGAVIIEQVFALPGVGNLTVANSLRSDVPVVMGCVFFSIVVVVVVNFLADLLMAWVNPKARVR